MNERFRRTREFEDAMARGASTHLAEVDVGTLYVNAELPGVWDRNFLRLDERAGDRSAAELVKLADDLLGAAGVKHRKMYIAAEHASIEMLDEFASLGWTRTDLATMAYGGQRLPPSDHVIEEVGASEYSPFEALCVDASPASEASVKEQLVSLVPLMARVGRSRFFLARQDGEAASGCHLYSDGEIAQVEDVMTLEPFRRRGLAGAVVSRAVESALQEGHSLVFLIVENETGPKRLYENLGFEDIGQTVELMLEPG